MNEIIGKDFDGVFRFTNATNEDFSALWNNVEYIFPAGKTVPLIIPNENVRKHPRNQKAVCLPISNERVLQR